jgi:hypothetical protein
MWLFTKHGFFSAVRARQRNGITASPSIQAESLSEPGFAGTSRLSRLGSLTGSGVARSSIPGGPITPNRCLSPSPPGGRYWPSWPSRPTTTTSSRRSPALRAGIAYEHALYDVWSVMNRLQKYGSRMGRGGGMGLPSGFHGTLSPPVQDCRSYRWGPRRPVDPTGDSLIFVLNDGASITVRRLSGHATVVLAGAQEKRLSVLHWGPGTKPRPLSWIR